MTISRAKSSAACAEAKRLIPGGVNSPVRAFRGVGGEPFFVDRAAGARIWDIDGNELVDFVGTWGPAILGHAPEVVVKAIAETATKGVSFGIPNPLEVEMARLIVDWVPSIEKVRMVNSGTEATMSALRLARGFTGRDKIVKFEGCYHGHADSLLVRAGSGALTHGEPDSAGVPRSLAELTLTLPFNDIEALKSVFATQGAEIAAVILEPIPANAGLYFPRPGFLEELRRLCTTHGAVLIFDEVADRATSRVADDCVRLARGSRSPLVIALGGLKTLMIGRAAAALSSDAAAATAQGRAAAAQARAAQTGNGRAGESRNPRHAGRNPGSRARG